MNLLNTDAVVLNSLEYTDSKRIINIYTKTHGKLSVLTFKPKKGSTALFQAFTIINCTIDFKPNRDLQRIHDYDISFFPSGILNDIYKNTVAIFLLEFLSKVLAHQQPDHVKFNYLTDAVHLLELTQKPVGSFHLIFMLQFAKFLGIDPQNNAQFQTEINHLFHNGLLTQTSLANCHTLQFNPAQKKQLTNLILNYYQHNFTEMQHLKSLNILRDVFA